MTKEENKIYLSKPITNNKVIIRLLIKENKTESLAIGLATNRAFKTWSKTNPIKLFKYESLTKDKDKIIKYVYDLIENILYQDDLLNNDLITDLIKDLENKKKNNILANETIESITKDLTPVKKEKFMNCFNYALDSLEPIKTPTNNKPKTFKDSLEDFLNKYYSLEIQELIKQYPNKQSLIIDYAKLEQENYLIADKLITDPQQIIKICNFLINNILNNTDKKTDIKTRFKNINNYTNLKNLLKDKIGQFIETKGIVKGISDINSEYKTVVYECLECARLYEIEQNDSAEILTPAICNECNGRRFKVVDKESTFKDTRNLLIEELNNDLIKANKPRRLLVKVTDDLLYKADTGQRINLIGQLALYDSNSKNKKEKKYMIKANYIENAENEDIKLTPEEIKEIKELAKNPNIINILIDSLAPKLIIPNEIKLGMLCYIVKGIVPPVDTGTLERDYLNILIISDPATGKTQLGQIVLNLTEKGLKTNGANSSGVGLSGAAIKDEVTGSFILEAGVIPLANGGHCLIDEFDKLPRTEQTKLLNFMESGEDTITKAGINETLQGRTGLLLLANPKYGRFDKYKPPAEQVNIYSPVLSRCDLIFILEDTPNYEKDLKIAKSILNQYTKKEQDNNIMSNGVDTNLIKKYLIYASRLKPKINDDSERFIYNYYAGLRSKLFEDEGVIPLDARILTSITRLSGAIAKLKLNNEVTIEDCKIAINLMEYSLKNAGYDPTTNKIDIDRVTGTSNSSDKRNRNEIIKIILSFINDENTLTNYIYKTKLKELFIENTGKGSSTFYNVYNQLLNANDLFERNGKVFINEQFIK